MSRGRGRGKPSVFTPQLLGHLDHAEIIKESRLGHTLYPDTPVPDTAPSSVLESTTARRFNAMVASCKFTPYWLDAPVKASADIERYSDQFKVAQTAADGTVTLLLVNTHKLRNYDRSLLPHAVFEAVFERKRNGSAVEGRRPKVLKKSADAIGDDEPDAAALRNPDEQSESEAEEEGDEPAEEEDEEDENDYGDNYFDGGEDDGGEGGDALGGGGDEDGGTFD